MKATFQILVGTIILIIYSYCFKYSEDTEIINLRNEYLINHTSLITNNKLSFSYKREQGTFCMVNKDLYYNEIFFKIPEQFILCSCK